MKTRFDFQKNIEGGKTTYPLQKRTVCKRNEKTMLQT